ncbi:MAG: hypothetical protein EAZ97_16505 [Bacteroidetes bacterium]|nr:MAG: hypothetical protein EAZ97_16505 [Bacteroidota bacterium]
MNGTRHDKNQVEFVIYGSSRLGTYSPVYNEYVNQFFGIAKNTLTLGYKAYELSNHLGNVLTTISDNYAPQPPTGGVSARVLSSQDYFPFGMVMTERSFQEKQERKYRWGFNGKENDEDIEGQDYGFRIYKENLCKFLSVDPLNAKYPWYSPYQFAGNKPIVFIDVDGAEEGFNIRLRQMEVGYLKGSVTEKELKDFHKGAALGAALGVGVIAVAAGTVYAAPIVASAAAKYGVGLMLNPIAQANLVGLAYGLAGGEDQIAFTGGDDVGRYVRKSANAMQNFFTKKSVDRLVMATVDKAQELLTPVSVSKSGNPTYQMAKDEMGPVLTGVLDNTTGEIFFGMNNKNGDLPDNLHPLIKNAVDVLEEAGGTGYKNTKGAGSHSEIYALDQAFKAREKLTGKKLTEADLGSFLIHNVGLRSKSAYSFIIKCPDCEEITKPVRTTQNAAPNITPRKE